MLVSSKWLDENVTEMSGIFIWSRALSGEKRSPDTFTFHFIGIS
jgi:hypothetical protein